MVCDGRFESAGAIHESKVVSTTFRQTKSQYGHSFSRRSCFVSGQLEMVVDFVHGRKAFEFGGLFLEQACAISKALLGVVSIVHSVTNAKFNPPTPNTFLITSCDSKAPSLVASRKSDSTIPDPRNHCVYPNVDHLYRQLIFLRPAPRIRLRGRQSETTIFAPPLLPKATCDVGTTLDDFAPERRGLALVAGYTVTRSDRLFIS